MKNCQFEEHADCSAPKADALTCLECLNAHRQALLNMILSVIQRVEMPFNVAMALADVLTMDYWSIVKIDQWFKKYEPEYYKIMAKKAEERRQKMQEFFEKLRGKNLGYRA